MLFYLLDKQTERNSMSDQNPVDQKNEKMIEYIRALKTIEACIEPYAEQKRELKAEFKNQGWLTGDEISMTVKAYRMMKDDIDFDQFTQFYTALMERAGRNV